MRNKNKLRHSDTIKKMATKKNQESSGVAGSENSSKLLALESCYSNRKIRNNSEWPPATKSETKNNSTPDDDSELTTSTTTEFENGDDSQSTKWILLLKR